jgi:hypothetical protein
MTLVDMTRSMMPYVDLPVYFWGETLSIIAYKLNGDKEKKKKSKLLTSFEY